MADLADCKCRRICIGDVPCIWYCSLCSTDNVWICVVQASGAYRNT